MQIKFERCVFFFQEEDGIGDGTVTGVQTCALPIFIPLPVQLCRIMYSPERLQQIAVSDLRRVKFYEHGLCVASLVRTDILVARLLRRTAGVSGRRAYHALHSSECSLDVPEAARGERCFFFHSKYHIV